MSAVVRLTAELEFVPYEVRVGVGGVVRWEVDGDVRRCIENALVVSDLGAACTRDAIVGESPPIFAGDAWELTFSQPGVFSVDSPTYDVKGRVIVEEGCGGLAGSKEGKPGSERPSDVGQDGPRGEGAGPVVARAPSPGRPPRPPTLPPPVPVSNAPTRPRPRPRLLSTDAAAAAADAGQPNLFHVRIRGYQFVPTTVRVPLGGVVRWTVTPDAEASHVIEAVDYCFESPVLQPGSTFEHTFSSENGYSVRTIRYINSVYPFMKGEVSILPPGMEIKPKPAPAPTPSAARAEAAVPVSAAPPRPPSPHQPSSSSSSSSLSSVSIPDTKPSRAEVVADTMVEEKEQEEKRMKAADAVVLEKPTPASSSRKTKSLPPSSTLPVAGKKKALAVGKPGGDNKEEQEEVDPAVLARQAAKRKKRNIKRSAARARARARARALSQSAGSSVDMTTSDSDFGGLIGIGPSPAVGASELATDPELRPAPPKGSTTMPASVSLSASASSVEVSPSEKSLSPPVTGTALPSPPPTVHVPSTTDPTVLRVPASSPSGTDDSATGDAPPKTRNRRSRNRRLRAARRKQAMTSSDPDSQLSDVTPSARPPSHHTSVVKTQVEDADDVDDDGVVGEDYEVVGGDGDDGDGFPPPPEDDLPPPPDEIPTPPPPDMAVDMSPLPHASPPPPPQVMTRDPVELTKAADAIRSMVGLPPSPRAGAASAPTREPRAIDLGAAAETGDGASGAGADGQNFNAAAACAMFKSRWRQTSFELEALASLSPLQRKNLAQNSLNNATLVIPHSAAAPHHHAHPY